MRSQITNTVNTANTPTMDVDSDITAMSSKKGAIMKIKARYR
jgi:hypothetical protein